MDERKKYKNAKDKQGKTQYKKLTNKVQRRCRKARNNWIEGTFKEIEKLFRIDKVNAAHKKTKQILGNDELM